MFQQYLWSHLFLMSRNIVSKLLFAFYDNSDCKNTNKKWAYEHVIYILLYWTFNTNVSCKLSTPFLIIHSTFQTFYISNQYIFYRSVNLHSHRKWFDNHDSSKFLVSIFFLICYFLTIISLYFSSSTQFIYFIIQLHP